LFAAFAEGIERIAVDSKYFGRLALIADDMMAEFEEIMGIETSVSTGYYTV
jgi:hypothetical protein